MEEEKKREMGRRTEGIGRSAGVTAGDVAPWAADSVGKEDF